MEPFYLMVAVVVLTVIFAAITFRRARRNTETFMSRISAAAGGTYRGGKGSATLGGTRFTYELVSQGRGVPAGMLVSVEIASGARFQVRDKGLESRLFPVGWQSELRATSTLVLTGDAEFDGEFSLLCDSLGTGGRLFASPRTREAARRILKRGYNVLKHDGETVAARISVTSVEAFAPRIVTEIVPLLAELAAAIRQNARPAPAPVLVPAHIAWPRRVAVAASVLFPIAAVPAYFGYVEYRVLDEWELTLTFLAVSVAFAGLVALVVLRLFKSTELLGCLAGALAALPLIGWWGGGWLNGHLDRGPPTVHVVLVVDSDPYNYYVTLASWRPDRRVVYLDAKQFSTVRGRGSQVAVTTMPGRFGFEWIRSAVHHRIASDR